MACLVPCGLKSEGGVGLSILGFGALRHARWPAQTSSYRRQSTSSSLASWLQLLDLTRIVPFPGAPCSKNP